MARSFIWKSRGRRILVIDDDEDFRRGLAENLRDDGYAVQEYAAAGEVPPQLSGIDLVITDYWMAGENGLSFAHRFRTEHPSVPVVMITAHSTPEVEKEAAASGFISMLHKPVRYEHVHRLIENLAGQNAS
jgi:two-component system response regulator GlrR